MRKLDTTITFRCPRFKPTPGELDESHDEYINPGVFAKEAANWLADRLNASGYEVVSIIQEDWGRWVEIANPDKYFLAIGVANYEAEAFRHEESETHMLFVNPDKSPIRKWFRKIPTEERVMQLVKDLQTIINSDSDITDVRLGEP